MSRETDIAIAQRVFGYKVRRRLFGWEMRQGIMYDHPTLVLAYEWVKVPSFSQHYARACEVVRKMRQRGWEVTLNDERGTCLMEKSVGHGRCRALTQSRYMTDAICSAALSACAIAMEG